MQFKNDIERVQFFEEKVVPNTEKLEHYAEKILKNQCDAEDVVQDAVLEAWEKIDSIRQVDKVFAWLSCCVRHKCLNLIKRRKTEEKVNEESLLITSQAMENILDVLICNYNNAIMECALNRLMPDERDIILCRIYFEQPADIVAKKYNTSANNIRVRQHRILCKLHIECEKIERGEGF